MEINIVELTTGEIKKIDTMKKIKWKIAASPRHFPMAWGFSLLTVQIVDDFSVRLVYLLIVELNIEVSG